MKLIAAALIMLLAVGLVNEASTSFAADPNGGNQKVVPEFSDSQVLTRTGVRDASGRCTFSPYKLQLKAGETARAARQVSLDKNTCTEVFEVGVPRDQLDRTPAGGSSLSTEAALAPVVVGASATTSQGSALAANINKNARFEVWWSDAFSLDVNKTWSRLNFTYDTGCVVGSSGAAYYWWQSATGWALKWSNTVLNRSTYGFCVPAPDNWNRSRTAYVVTDSNFKNGVFCAGFDTWVYYRGVTVIGYYDGGVNGWVDSTWVEEPTGCPFLHWHQLLRNGTY